ncbi:MAG TPA: YjbQ family protein [Terriglobales bacterium]|nr:YjbQ family protein [Terriglobales bacterium]
MKSHTAYFTFHTSRHREYLNLTARVAAELQTSGIQEGMALVSAMHITAGVWWRQRGHALSASGRPLSGIEARTPSDHRERPKQKVASHVNDAESGLLADIDAWLERLAPFRADYQHHRTGETNGDAHLKSLLVHHEVIVPVTAGRLDLGPWQQIYYEAQRRLGAPGPPSRREHAAPRRYSGAAHKRDARRRRAGARAHHEFDGQRPKRVIVKILGE